MVEYYLQLKSNRVASENSTDLTTDAGTYWSVFANASLTNAWADPFGIAGGYLLDYTTDVVCTNMA